MSDRACHSPGQKTKTRLAVELPVTDYRTIHQLQLDLIAARRTGDLAHDVVFILEHHPVFTIGRHGSKDHLLAGRSILARKGIPVVRIERGGEITYHGPGQVVGYPIIDLKKAGVSVKEHMTNLEEIMIRTAADFGVRAERTPVNPGVWVDGRKLGSIGVAVRHGITFHGFALNVNLDLTPFEWINPCGLKGVRMTSLEKEKNAPAPMTALRRRVWHHLAERTGCQLRFVGVSDLLSGRPEAGMISPGRTTGQARSI